MNETILNACWNDLPIGRENAISYPDLIKLWGVSERKVREILHDLSSIDNGDDYVLIRSSKVKGFYKTDNEDEIEAYKSECLAKGKSVFAPVRKINRILNQDTLQLTFDNNLRAIRTERNLKQSEVCAIMKQYDFSVDKSMMSKFENGVCLPTPYQLSILAKIYNCRPEDLIRLDIYGI